MVTDGIVEGEVLDNLPESTQSSSFERESIALPSPERLQQQNLMQVIQSYLRYYASGEGHTARAKQYDLKYFVEYLAGLSSCRAEEVAVSMWTMQATKNYIDYRLSLGEAPSTVNRRLATLKHFGRTLAERVHGFINPAREVKGPTLAVTRPHGLTLREINLLLEAADKEVEEKNNSFNAVRNRFLLALLVGTGLRADEVRLLLIAQLSDDLDWLKNVRTKGRKYRNVYVDSSIRQTFRAYLEARERELLKRFSEFSALPLKDQQRYPVLISLYAAQLGDPTSFGLAPKTIWRAVANFGKTAQALSTSSIPNLHPHKLRHTFAHGLLDSSKDVRLVAQALGHSDVRTTMRYTERTDEQVAKAIEEKVNGKDKD
jgi:site-specific recombinase XerD